MITDEDGEFVAWEDGERVGRGRPVADKREIQRRHAEALGKDGSEVRAGVTATWLAAAFKMDLRTVKNRLGALKPSGNLGPRKAATYDFSDAVTLLAKPPPDQLARYLKTIRVQDMPTHLQESYWGALRKKQIWEQHAGDLWKTVDVLDVFAETFKTLKSRMQLWVDNLDTKGEMTQQQRDRLTQMVDGLMDDLHTALIEMPSKRQTRSSLHDPDANPDSLAQEQDEEDGDLIG
jgi:hypothetical protein